MVMPNGRISDGADGLGGPDFDRRHRPGFGVRLLLISPYLIIAILVIAAVVLSVVY